MSSRARCSDSLRMPERKGLSSTEEVEGNFAIQVVRRNRRESEKRGVGGQV